MFGAAAGNSGRCNFAPFSGKIPDNLILVFKDKNTDNVVIENLELITRTESMLRNSRHNYPHEIIPSMILIKKLENKLNDLKND